jgi:hypothetical protein
MQVEHFIRDTPLELDEDRYNEFKEVTGHPIRRIKEVCDEYVVAFLNARGGRILWGITNVDRRAVGVSLTYTQKDELRRAVTDKINEIRPAISPAAYKINIHPLYENEEYQTVVEDKYIVEIIAPPVFSNDLYRTASGKVFMRTDAGIRKMSEEQIKDEIRRRQTFRPALDVFGAMICRNFLFEFDGPNSDYRELLSSDLRSLFFHKLRDCRESRTNRMLISGREGSGKTFNTMLLSIQLAREGYQVFYCPDITNVNVTAENVRGFADRNDKLNVLIIDNSQNDITKAEDLVSSLPRPDSDGPTFIFLTRPLDEDTRLDTFGRQTSLINMVDKFLDFEKLIKLFFRKLGNPGAAEDFMREKAAARLPNFAFGYRNMAFWNELLRALSEERAPSLSEDAILGALCLFTR